MRKLAFLFVLLAGCSSVATAVDPAPTGSIASERALLRIPLSLYVVTDADDPESGLSSQRTVEEVESIAEEIAAIWAVADIVFDPVVVEAIEVPGSVLNSIAVSRSTDTFFAEAGRTFEIPNAGLLNGFYMREVGGVNGFTPLTSRVFFVTDVPSVHDERVSSHEVGHILGLHHARSDTGRLMFSGTNGMTLTDEEQLVSRYFTEGLLDGSQ